MASVSCTEDEKSVGQWKARAVSEDFTKNQKQTDELDILIDKIIDEEEIKMDCQNQTNESVKYDRIFKAFGEKVCLENRLQRFVRPGKRHINNQKAATCYEFGISGFQTNFKAVIYRSNPMPKVHL